ncbi:MAG TPA: NAD(P)-dependent oxidoreductase [Pseudonocardiaceae bacterium]
MTIKSVAVLGLGGMGGGMARTLLRAGFAVTVYNRSKDKAAPLVDAGATLANSASEVGADADVLLISLADESAVDELLFGEVVWQLKPGTVIIDTTTVSPSFAKNTAIRLAASGVDRLEACVVGNPEMAANGQLRIFVAGEQAALTKAEPVLSALGQEIRHLGAVGRASALKLALNLMLGVQTAALAEAASFVQAAGLDRDLLLDVVMNSGWRSPVLGFRVDFMRRREYQPAGFRTALMHKDLDLALQQAAAYQVSLPLTSAATDRFQTVIESGRGDDDAAVVVELP